MDFLWIDELGTLARRYEWTCQRAEKSSRQKRMRFSLTGSGSESTLRGDPFRFPWIMGTKARRFPHAAGLSRLRSEMPNGDDNDEEVEPSEEPAEEPSHEETTPEDD